MTSKQDNKTNITQKSAQQDETRQKVNAVLDEIINAVSREPQRDSYFESKALEIKAIDEQGFTHIAKKFAKADPKEKEILVQFLKFWTGVEHIKFLQDFIQREPFWPRIGTIILELFNKRDAMLESGLATRLLELESITQRMKQHIILKDPLDDTSVEKTLDEFLCRSEKEKEGIIVQLMDEVGSDVTPYLLKLFSKNTAWQKTAIEFIGSLATISSYTILQNLYKETRDKNILKIIKKSAHSLRQKGIEIFDMEPQETGEAVFKKITLPEARAFISQIDGIGDRIIFMVKPFTTYESRLFEIYLSDVHGIRELASVTAFRKEAEKFINKITTDEKILFVETTTENACFLVEEAYRINQENGTVVAGSIAQWRSTYTDVSGSQTQPVIYSCLDAEMIRNQELLLMNCGELFKHLELIVWFVESEEAKDGWRKCRQAKNSPLVLSPYQQEERLQEHYRETAAAFFNQKRRALFKRRLEEMAYIFHKQSSEKHAQIALAAALSLASEILPPEKNIFCLNLVTEGFKLYESNTQVRNNRDSVIIDPKDVSLIA